MTALTPSERAAKRREKWQAEHPEDLFGAPAYQSVPREVEPEPEPEPEPNPGQASSDKSDHSEPPERFEEFWETYGNKVGRKKSEVAYRNALKKPGVTDDLLIAAAAQYVEWCRETDTYLKNPLTWLHGEHWADERVARRQPKTRVQEHLSLVEQLAAEEAEAEQQNLREIGYR